MTANTLLQDALGGLSERTEKHHQGLLAEIQSQYEDCLDEISNAEFLSRQTGISVSAFLDLSSLRYAPAVEFPALLRMGTLRQRNTSQLNTNAIPYYREFQSYRNIIIKDFDIKTTHKILQAMALRILSSFEPDLIDFYFVDPTGLGHHFSDFTELSNAIKDEKILTETEEIERMLAEARATTVNLIQQKITHKYENLQAYNAKAGRILSEPYRFIFISSFPFGFSQRAIETLISIINTSSKSGISVLMSVNEEELSNHRGLVKTIGEMPFSIITPQNMSDIDAENFVKENFEIEIDDYMPENAQDIILNANKRILHLQTRTIDIDEFQSDEPFTETSVAGLQIPIGIIGKGKPCVFTLGTNTSGHHAILGGATGSGKSVLLHNIITNGAWHYSPEELKFYLLDYKEGTEFKIYENLPHVQILSMESNRAFGLSMLQYIGEEIERRGKLFKQAGVAKIVDYRKKTENILPRILVVIDEFQVLLQGQGRLSRKGTEMLDDISRRGRSFGVHIILSTQTLSEVNLKNSTLSNIAIRIGLKMSESDAAKLFHRDNTVAATLKKAGEGFYNDTHGKSEGNVRINVAYLDAQKIEERIADINTISTSDIDLHRFIFDGQHHIPFSKSKLQELIKGDKTDINSRSATLYLSEPGYIDSNLACIQLRRQFTSNILMVGDSPHDVVSLSMLIVFQLIRQSTPSSQFYIADLFADDTQWSGHFRNLTHLFPERVSLVDNKNFSEVLTRIETSIDDCIAKDKQVTDRTVLVILNVQAARILDSKVISGSADTKKLEKIIKKGSEHGTYVVLHSLHYQGLEKVFTNRNIIGEFENRIIVPGGNSEKMLPHDRQGQIQQGTAYLISPQARFDADPCRLYEPDEVINYFQGLTNDS